MSKYPKHLGRFLVRDSMGVDSLTGDALEQRLRETQYNEGNATYILSLPLPAEGNYEGVDAGEMMDIFRLGMGGERSLVASVPTGIYRLETDAAGAHLYRLSEDEPERALLSDTPIRVGDHGQMSDALARMNERNARYYDSGAKLISTKPAQRVLARSNDAAALINQRNRAFYGC